MTSRCDNRVVVVTGGTSGIGLATAKAFAAEGAFVFVTGRRQETLDAALKDIGGNVTGIRGDMAELADIDRLYDAVRIKHAHIDVPLPMRAAVRSRRLALLWKSTTSRSSTRM